MAAQPGVIAAVAGAPAPALLPAMASGLAITAICVTLCFPCMAAYDRYTACLKDWPWYHPVCAPMMVVKEGKSL